MTSDMSVWSYVTHWLGYVSWCAATSDATCRPFVGFLALLGAAAGLSSLFLLGMVRMLHGWERDVVAARAARTRQVSAESMPAIPAPLASAPAIAAIPAEAEPAIAPSGLLGSVPSRPEPALGLALPAPAYPAHAEPLLLKTP